jgi:hypothetical protein
MNSRYGTTAWRAVALVAALALPALSACESDDGSTTSAENGGNGGNGGNGDATGGESPLTCDDATGVCTLEGEYTEDLTLTADKQYLIEGGVFIGDDTNETVLTIEPGTTIYGDSGASVLVIRRGSKIMAEGTKDAPIVFTSAREDGQRARGDWGGIVINGRARINACAGAADPCEAEGEGDTGKYGGSDDADSSGSLTYVRVQFAGYQITSENELNGIAFQAVGSGTAVDHLQLHMNADDGIEFFGGTVGVKHVLVTGSGDDSLDWTDGWRGKAQFVAVQQYEDESDNGIEADNLKADNNAEPRSEPWLSNFTLVGSPGSSSSDLGILLREGTGVHLMNSIIVGFGEACVDVDNDATYDNAGTPEAPSGKLDFENVILSCDTAFKVASGDDDPDPFSIEEYFTAMPGVTVSDPMLAAPFDLAARDFSPKAGSPALTGGEAPSDSFFEKVTYLGAFGPDADWTAGWTETARK